MREIRQWFSWPAVIVRISVRKRLGRPFMLAGMPIQSNPPLWTLSAADPCVEREAVGATVGLNVLEEALPKVG